MGATGPAGSLSLPPGATGTLTATLNSITANIAVGAVAANQVINSGTTLEGFITALLVSTFYPTIEEPSAGISSNLALSAEIGTTGDLTLTVSYSPGNIAGNTVGGVWNAGVSQGARAGAANKYTIAGEDRLLQNTRNIGTITYAATPLSYSASVAFDAGTVQPVDSKGANFGSVKTAGTVSTPTISLSGYRKLFYGSDNSPTVPTATSNFIRLLSGKINSPSAGMAAFNISIPVGATSVWIAYPSTIRAISNSSIVYIEGLGSSVGSNFVETSLTVQGAGSDTGISYRIYKYVPDAPFSQTATYRVSI